MKRSKNKGKLFFGDRPQCFFWNYSGKCWSNKGCYYRNLISDRVNSVCECNHLTSFTVLVDIHNRDDPNDPVKNYLTITVSALSIICTLIALYISRQYNRETLNVLNDQFRSKSNLFLLNFHIGIWLIITNLFVLFGLDRDDYKVFSIFIF